MTPLSPKSQQTLESLKKSVAKALEKKRRLGQYAVVWRDGHIVYLNREQQPDGDNSTMPTGKR